MLLSPSREDGWKRQLLFWVSGGAFPLQQELLLLSLSSCTSSIPCCRNHLSLYLFRQHHSILTEFLRSIFFVIVIEFNEAVIWRVKLNSDDNVIQTIGSRRFGEVSFRSVTNDYFLFLTTLCKATISFKFSIIRKLKSSDYPIKAF